MKTYLILLLSIVTLSCSAQRGFKNITERDGKIGIGTNMPDELLTVKGKIHTQEVIVDLNGAVAPDYVFERYYTGKSSTNAEYRLLSLKEVEQFIQKNNHLPDIPSAEKINQNGLSLKEMNLLLLRKIEELTLYTLEQQKEIDALKKMINKNQ